MEDKKIFNISITSNDKQSYIDFFSKRSNMIKTLKKILIRRMLVNYLFFIIYIFVLPNLILKYIDSPLFSISTFNIGRYRMILIGLFIYTTIISGVSYLCKLKLIKNNIKNVLKGKNSINYYGVDMGVCSVNNLTDEYILSFDSDKITIETELYQTSITWENVKDIVKVKDYLYIFQSPRKLFFLIPLNKDNKDRLLKIVSENSNVELREVN